MNNYTVAAWSVIIGLSLMLVGGLVLWAYGARQPRTAIASEGPEAASTQLFHTRLTRWFFTYGVLIIVAGTAMLLWAGSQFF